jgi:lipopolysaccharide biosynthesis glycosyltransferase
MNNVIVICTDNNYINHVKYNINNIREKHGEIDICITYEERFEVEIQKELSNFNVIFKSFKRKRNDLTSFGQKYHIFDVFFKKWEKILYIDCDTVVFSNLNPLFNLLDNNNFVVDFENNSIRNFFSMWVNLIPLPDDNEELINSKFKELDNETYVDVNQSGFNSGILLFNSKIIESDTIDTLYTLSDKYKLINRHGQNGGQEGDQPIINLLFAKYCHQVPNNMFCFWRGINHNTIIGHFCRWEAPWINGTYSDSLGTSYANYYNKKLN